MWQLGLMNTPIRSSLVKKILCVSPLAACTLLYSNEHVSIPAQCSLDTKLNMCARHRL